MSEDERPSSRSVASTQQQDLARPQFGGGRLGTYTFLGAASGIVPLPWVPDAIVRRIRGALVHDLVARHGLSLTPEARAVLTDPGGGTGAKGYFRQGAVFAATRILGRLGPFALVSPVRTALGTFVLGHLLSRYLENARSAGSIRIEVDEARRVRRAIDQALLYAVTTDGKSHEPMPIPADDLRDSSTQVIDGVLISIASLPGWLTKRLDAAFDETLASLPA